MLNDRDLSWPRPRIQRALLTGDIVGLSAVGGTVKFVCKNGIDAGHLVDGAGAIKRFASDAAAWALIDNIKSAVVKKRGLRAA